MNATAIALGVLYTLFLEVVAFMMVGGGHGWLTPFFWGPLGLIVFSLCAHAALTARSNAQADRSALILAIVAAVIANFLIVMATLDEGLEYVGKAGPFAYAWMGFWVTGQVPLVYAIIRRVLAPKEAA